MSVSCCSFLFRQLSWKLDGPFCSSCRGLNGGFDLSGRPLLLPPGVLADKGAVFVELRVLVAVVHQAVPAFHRFDLPAQRVLAALQWLLVVVAAREAQWI